jgi:nitric oxide reductase NorE protein
LTGNAQRIPGEGGVWALIAGDLLFFTLFFFVFAQAAAKQPALFAAGHRLLDTGLGLVNTLLLLTSSLLVAIGVERAKQSIRSAPIPIRIAMVCGFGFVIVKVFEYSAKIGQGITPLSSEFFVYYYAFTGIHLFHVLLGLAALAWAQFEVSSIPLPDKRIALLESAALFWHLVDLLWIVLFALFYVLVPL